MDETPAAIWPKRLSLAVLGVYWLVLATATHLPNVAPPPGFDPGDKAEHLAAFGLLAVLLAVAWSFHRPMTWRSLAAILAIVAVYAAIDEITQPLTGRNRDPLDWIADVLGASAGLAIFAVVYRLRRR